MARASPPSSWPAKHAQAKAGGRPSTSRGTRSEEDVDGGAKPGHDGGGKAAVSSDSPFHLQPPRWADPLIASRISGRGDGYSARSFVRVSQAAFFSLMAISELARPSSASGACKPTLDRL